MQDFLIFTLYGPLVAWGDIAVGEYRPSLSHPSKSAILGLIAGALGIDRYDDEAHRALDAFLGFGLRVESIGELLRDYHTVQVPASPNTVHSTRQSELQDERIKTILSQRDYRNDAYAESAIWLKGKSNYQLADIANALHQPYYAPFLGRKSCTPALPFDPAIIKAETLKDAFQKYHKETKIPEKLREKLRRSIVRYGTQGNSASIHWEDGIHSGITNVRQITQKDRVISRKKWQFRDRVEYSGMEE